jgi:hypothetical protein
MNYVSINKDGLITIDKDNLTDLPNTNGTSLVDGIIATYEELVHTFGEPNSENDGYKTDAEWVIDTPSGVATIYNYKSGHNYLGRDGLDVWDITDWHIGGNDASVRDWIIKVLPK